MDHKNDTKGESNEANALYENTNSSHKCWTFVWHSWFNILIGGFIDWLICTVKTSSGFSNTREMWGYNHSHFSLFLQCSHWLARRRTNNNILEAIRTACDDHDHRIFVKDDRKFVILDLLQIKFSKSNLIQLSFEQ